MITRGTPILGNLHMGTKYPEKKQEIDSPNLVSRGLPRHRKRAQAAEMYIP